MRRKIELAAFGAGIAAIIYGLIRISVPAAWVAGGFTLIFFAILSRRTA